MKMIKVIKWIAIGGSLLIGGALLDRHSDTFSGVVGKTESGLQKSLDWIKGKVKLK